jgi:flagellar basal-body rod modification protein FlgD
MAATALGIFNHLSTTGQEQRNAAPLKNVQNNASSSGATASGADAAGITANDFLTLLVTEMKNQDPTANTDPNEYINQLVQVNSLEQLISINQTLTADSQGSPANAAVRGTAATMHGSTSAQVRGQHPAAASIEAPAAQASTFGTVIPNPAQSAVGNLTVPASNPAAQRVAHSLGGIRPAI